MENTFNKITSDALNSSGKFSFQIAENLFIVNGQKLIEVQSFEVQNAEFVELLDYNLSVSADINKVYLMSFEEGFSKSSEVISFSAERHHYISEGAKSQDFTIDDLDDFIVNSGMIYKDLLFIDDLIENGISEYLSNTMYDFYVVTKKYIVDHGIDIGGIEGCLFLGVLDCNDDIENISIIRF